ncbi:hypothetical protein ABZS66_40365, partial [Dactylosporangium sp. NPDC005572]|uniref:hypothetical protein n=1 Tax=Dactylosporangium sp. NPDC005572 TaxID=3156889 RepID=UPI0033A9C0CF
SLTGAPLEAAPADGSSAGRVPASRRMAAGDLAAVRDRLGAPAFRAAFDDGRLLGFDQLAGLAERLSRFAAE